MLKALYGLVAVLAILAGGAAILPDAARVERYVTIKAPPDQIFAIIGDLKRFPEFSPWTNPDFGLHFSFKGSDTGVGQTILWYSDNLEIGRGSLKVMEYQPQKHIAMAVNLSNGKEAVMDLDLQPVATKTAVIWRFELPLRGPLERWLGIEYRHRLADDSEIGLAKLAAIAEKQIQDSNGVLESSGDGMVGAR